MSLKKSSTGIPAWKVLTARYQKSDTRKSIWQFCNTFIPFIISWYLMYRSLEVSYWLTLLLLLPTTGFIMLLFRFPSYRYKELKPFYNSVYITSLAIILFVGILIWLIGLKAFLIIQLPISFISSSAGMWIFFVQHQFENTYWNAKDNWDY